MRRVSIPKRPNSPEARMKYIKRIPVARAYTMSGKIISWYRRMVKCRAMIDWVNSHRARVEAMKRKEVRDKKREIRLRRELVVHGQQQQLAIQRFHEEQKARMELELRDVMKKELFNMTNALKGGVIDTLNGAAVQQTLETQKTLGQVETQRDEETQKRIKAENEAKKAKAKVEKLQKEVAEYDLYQASQSALAEADHETLEETTEKYNTLVTDSTRSDTRAKSLCRRNLLNITVLESFYSKDTYPLYKFYMKYNTDEEGVGHLPSTREEAQKFINEFQPDSTNVFDVLSHTIDIQHWVTMKLNEKHKLIVSHYQSMNTNDRNLERATWLLENVARYKQLCAWWIVVGMAVEATNAALNGRQALADDSAIQETIREAGLLSDTL